MRGRTTDPASGRPAADSAAVQGVVLRLRLVAPGGGRASGSFEAAGAVSGGGTAVTDAFVPSRPGESAVALLVEGAVRLQTAGGELVTGISTAVRPVPGAGTLSGGGTWTLSHASGEFDGLRAAGTLTVVITYDTSGTAVLELVLTGRVAQP
jgi:hypothetical protein